MDPSLILVRAAKVLRLLRRPGLWPAARLGVIPALEHARIPFAYSYAVVVDVGASRGQFALFAAHRWPDAAIHCFEPFPDSQRTLKRVLNSRVTLYPNAVSDVAGEVTLHVSGRDDSSSLLRIGARQVAEFPGTEETHAITVDAVRLDDVIAPQQIPGLSLLKIDVQGGELGVLKGAPRLLEAISDLYCECSFVELYDGQALISEIVGYVYQYGFQMKSIANIARSASGEVLQADVLFRRPLA